MPRNHDIKKVLVIGSGPIVIGQAGLNLGRGRFLRGTQCKADRYDC